MTESHLQNENGKFLPVLAIDGRFYPREFQKEIIRGIPSVGLRRDDLYLCGYPRSVMWSSWWEHVRSFEKLLASMDTDLAHIVFYEELKENPLKVVRDLSTFLHRPIEVEKLQEIVDKCSFRSMKSVKDNLNINWDGKKAQYRKGIVGDWKNVFTQSQAEKFHQVYSEKMAGSAYYKRYLDV